MGTVTGTQIINRARTTLLDDASVPGGGAVTWDRSALPGELFEHLKAGLRAISAAKPNTYTANQPQQLVPGIRQAIPAASSVLIDVRRNLGTDGATPGRAIRPVSMQKMDDAEPDWPTEPASQIVRSWMHDKREEKVFYVSPPQPNPASWVEVVTAEVPTMATAGEAIPINDVYEQALYCFVLAHAWAKNSKRGDYAKANYYYAQFQQAIGLKAQAQLELEGGEPDGNA